MFFEERIAIPRKKYLFIKITIHVELYKANTNTRGKITQKKQRE